MSFCLLTDPLPDAALGLSVQTDFRHMVRFENGLFRTKEADWPRFVQATLWELFGPDGLRDVPRSWDALLWFYSCGRYASGEEMRSAASGAPFAARAWDYAADGQLIAAAFRQAYGIDLTDPALQLHWWQFRALFDGLPADCALHKIMEYRTADTSDMPEKTRQLYEAMRKKYALPGEIGGEPHYATLEEREAAFLARLPGG